MQKSIILTATIIFQANLCLTQFNKPWTEKYEGNNRCPKLYPKNFVNYAPVGNFTAGNYTEKTDLKGLRKCVLSCCLSESCNVAFLVDGHCFHIECVSDELCLPLLRSNNRKWESHVSMILVKPVLPNENWPDILDQVTDREIHNFVPEEETVFSPYSSRRNQLPEDEEHFLSHFLSNLPMETEDGSRSSIFRGNSDGDMLMDATMFLDKIPCGTPEDCPYNYECVPLSIKTRNGICKCLTTADGSCIDGMRPYSKGPTDDIDGLKKTDIFGEIKTDGLPSVQNLTVSISNKTVQLPDNEVTLAAFTIPDEKPPNHYSYVWTLVDQPKETFTGNMKQNGATVTLTDLTEGQYQFKVAVNGTRAYGEGFGSVTVLPAHRVNTPPRAIVTPPAQTIKLPNSMAVLDASASQDDVGIKSYHWELTAGPIGYQPPLEDKQTLVLKDLKLPGNYTFKLTVEDTDNVKNSTTANITVLNHTDYPPEANAGQDVIIYLPHNELTLNGSLSTDDHEITSWEWTKAVEDENKAVDMQNTHSPYLQLSNLSEGMYTFVLKVTDSSGQTSKAEVHVYVKPPTNTPPVADAGPDHFISLPQTWVTLNGSGSHDDHKIVSYTWTCVEGPNNSTIVGFNESIANATGLTKGQYVFTLTVVDDNGNPASDNVSVTVAQNKNSPPKANAGGDQILALPLPVLVVNGSRSSDDFRVVSWRWARQPSGMAAGTVILGSDTKPVLMLTNIEPGRYVFELTVTDDQGESDRDTVSIQVKPDPHENNLLELTLNVPISTFTQSQLNSLVEKMTLLLKDTRVNVTEVRGEIDSGNTQVIFMLWANNAAVEGMSALSLVEEAGVPGGSRLRSVRCLSSCSGRGRCDQATRTCRCDAFWTQSLWPPWPHQPDCDWSVVYTVLGGVGAVCALCGAASLSGRRCRRKRKPYTLLPADREAQPFTNKSMSESETDSDVLFESKTKTSSFITRMSNGDGPLKSNVKKNGHYKSTRRIRT